MISEQTEQEQNASTDAIPQPSTRMQQLASRHRIHSTGRSLPWPVAALDAQAALIDDAYTFYRKQSARDAFLSYGAEWLLDNYYIVQRTQREIRDDMPRTYYRQLPKLAEGEMAGQARVYAVARTLIQENEARLDPEQLAASLHAYQDVTPLTMGELWAVPTMLRLGLIGALAQALARATELPWRQGPPPPVAPTFPAHTADENIIANAIISLRMLETQDWETFFEQTSHVEQALRMDPAQIYGAMDFETRDRYRKVVETLALATKHDEIDAAQRAIELAGQHAQRNGAAAARHEHVGYFLIDRGRQQLERELGYRPRGMAWLQRWVDEHPTLFYLGAIALITLLIFLPLFWYASARSAPAQWIAAAVLLLIPALTIAIGLFHSLLTRFRTPRMLPKLDCSAGIPAAFRTMVVVPALFTSEGEVDSLLQQLEQHYLSNTDPNLGFALLSDFADAPHETMPEDDALVAHAKAGVRALNERYGAEREPFYFFHRVRRWNPSEGVWMGWERKRGKLHEFNRLLRADADDTSYVVCMGNLDIVSTVRYVITLDADTELPLGSASRLVGALAHPLNRAEFQAGEDADVSRVTAGYTILQPRTEVKPVSASQSLFTQIFSGDAGLDLYTRAVSDVYQDLVGEGSYVGKGIYDVDAFERSLAQRIPDNTLLSHDLLEGLHGRAGLVTDIIVYEDYPPSYLVQASRMHRWMRGDWQLLPWLGARVPHTQKGSSPNPLPIIGRWKIVDNLRRSLLAPILVLLLAAGWVWLPGSSLLWTLVAALTLAIPLLSSVLGGIIEGMRTTSWLGFARAAGPPCWRWLLALTFLPFEALLALDAIGRTLYRMIVSRRQLLEWTTAARAARLFKEEDSLLTTWVRMIGGPLIALALTIWIGLAHPSALFVAWPFLVAWFLSPYIAYWISRPRQEKQVTLTDEQQQMLRSLARRTWLYFEQFVGPDDNWLPPDHFQESPLGIVAHRTSPTNIGLMLLSTLTAHDFGYEGPYSMAMRLQNAFDSMDRLEHYRGHLLNWYNTRTLQPLPPRYVSFVDSGNLAACLIALRQGLQAVIQTPRPRWQRWHGLLDNLALFAEVLEKLRSADSTRVEAVQADLDALRAEVRALRDESPAARTAALLTINEQTWPHIHQQTMRLFEADELEVDAHTLHSLRICVDRVQHHLASMRRDLDLFAPWLLSLQEAPALLQNGEDDNANEKQTNANSSLHAIWRELQEKLSTSHALSAVPDVCANMMTDVERLDRALETATASQAAVESARAWSATLMDRLRQSQAAAQNLLDICCRLRERAAARVRQMEFGFLYDTQRHVFHIGYNLEADALDHNYYDLLASEARIGSLVAIAKGDVPPRHWLHMGRPLNRINQKRGLLSWSGTMFEYLMPYLLLRSYPHTLLHQSSLAAIDRQMQYGREHQIPWGVSESGFYEFDANQFYQYHAFGVPGLGLKRGLGEDRVITPYASLLALSFRPQAVLENVAALQQQGMLGDYGLYEAIDYSTARLPLGQQRAVVRSFMVHHQGMILLSLLNFLEDDVMVRRFHADPTIQSVELLLQEQIPHHAPIEELSEQESVMSAQVEPQIAATPWSLPAQTPTPQVQYLSNGRYASLITNSGGGYNRWQETDLTRWRADTTQDDWGLWVYLYDQVDGALWTITRQPVEGTTEHREVSFAPHRVDFHCEAHDIAAHMAITVPPEMDVEIRSLRLINLGDRPRTLTLSSYGEVILTAQSGDRRHPAFNKMFIESEFHADLNALLFRRRPRSAEESPLYMGHALVLGAARASQTSETTVVYETDRRRFLGRGRTVHQPTLFDGTGEEALAGFSNAAGATLDPILALGRTIDLAPHESVELAFVTAAGDSRDAVLSLIGHYQDLSRVSHAFSQAEAQSERALRQLSLTSDELADVQRLLSLLLYPHPALRADPAVLAANMLGQPALWPHAISGDYPILLVRIEDDEQIALVQELLRAHSYWRQRNLRIDLVILNQKETGYAQELQGKLHRLLVRTNGDRWLNRRGGIFVVRADTLDSASRTLLYSAARVLLDGAEHGTLAEQLADRRTALPALPRFTPLLSPDEQDGVTPPLPRPTELQFDNGYGGFRDDGREYMIYLDAPERATETSPAWTPAPWTNVIANDHFGFLVTESGGGYTWALNSGENRLTPWLNDPVSDRRGEALYLRDEETASIWTPTPLPAGEDAPYLVRHGAGYSVIEHHSHGLEQSVRYFAPMDAPVKIVTLRVKNIWDRPRRITATYYAEWVLGVDRDTMQQYVAPDYHDETQALLARNPYNTEFSGRVAFLAASRDAHGQTTDRTEFLGRLGSLERPAALTRIGLSGRVQAGSDPCAAYQIHLDLQPGESQDIHFLLGQGADRDDALHWITHYQDEGRIEQAWEQMHAFWDGVLETVQVNTPEPAMDLLLNRWLLYQNLACRVWGRSAFYQSSGAYGFRDQLQDVMALLHAQPDEARRHILRAARHQFEVGDVLHWWHPPSGRGVRTRITDDLLWLPYVTAHYVLTTGDMAILEEKVPFRQGEPLDEGVEDRYGEYDITAESYTLFEHCRRAIRRGTTAGPHGLPLIGAGDWNDGMNRVGIEGKGESVWLGWFLCDTLRAFADLCERTGRDEAAETYRTQACELRRTVEENAWDGGWYRRGYYDDGRGGREDALVMWLTGLGSAAGVGQE